MHEASPASPNENSTPLSAEDQVFLAQARGFFDKSPTTTDEEINVLNPLLGKFRDMARRDYRRAFALTKYMVQSADEKERWMGCYVVGDLLRADIARHGYLFAGAAGLFITAARDSNIDIQQSLSYEVYTEMQNDPVFTRDTFHTLFMWALDVEGLDEAVSRDPDNL